MQRQANSNAEQDKDNNFFNPFAENEHVGIDEEAIYQEIAPVHVVDSCNEEKDEKYCSDDDSEDESEMEMDMESEIEVEADEVILEYNKEDPPMSVGTSYPTMKEFKLPLS